MNKDYDKNEYIKTALWTLFLAVFLVAGALIDLGINIQSKKETVLHKIQMQNERLELQKLYYLEKTEPNNYMINLKIAVLHQIFKEYDKAQLNYEKALSKSGNSSFALYRAAMFFASRNQYMRSIELANLLPNIEDKKIFAMKAKIYSQLGKSFLEEEDFANSIKSYKIAYKFAKNTDKELKTTIAMQYANAYSELADKRIEENDLNLAVLALNNAIDVYPDAHASYKLGLIYQNIDDEKAQKYFEQAYMNSPEIVNLELYYNLIKKLIKKANDGGDLSKGRYYTLKLTNLKRKANSYYIFKDDIDIKNVEIINKRKFIFGKKETYAIFSVKNNTRYKIENLYLKVVVRAKNDYVLNGENKVVSPSSTLDGQKILTGAKVKLEGNIEKFSSVSHYAQMEIYARKNKRAPWILIDFLAVNFIK